MIGVWLSAFLYRLSSSFPPHDWPDPGTADWDVFVEDFRKAFARNGVSEAEAEEARSLLAENPPRFRADYIPKVVGAVKIHRELSPATDGLDGDMDEREGAARASRTCIRCFGDGLAIVYASKPDAERKIPESTAAYCVCPYGKWVERNHRERCPDIHSRIPHLSNVLAGRSFWRLDPLWFGQPSNRPPTESLPEMVKRVAGASDTNLRRRYPADLGRVDPAVPIPPRAPAATREEVAP